MDPIEFINSGQVISDKLISENPFNVFFWILIVFNLISIAIAKAAHRNYLKTLFSTSVLNRYLMQNVQEDLKLKSFGSFLLTLSYFNSFAIIVSFLAGEPIGLFTMKILAILIVGILLKLALMKSISFISITRIGLEEHYLNHLVFYQVGSLILTILLLSLSFTPTHLVYTVLIIALCIITMLIIIREFQSLIRAIKLRISIFYLILYLCTLELLPLVLIIYTLVSNIEELN